jgi:catechol 2,3-dioxygenase-like lactoylglutathione lyase family enzyme
MEMPSIVSPVARCIAVSDAGRSRTFYRDVLGFEIRDCEAVRGPARLAFEPSAAASRSMLFFEIDDVAAMHAELASRGAAPSATERVNWIKMELFEVRDPDGHSLFFGQSFDRPQTLRPDPMMQQALPELPVDDVAAAVAHYRDVLGFHINYQQDDLGVMDRDRVTVLLIPRRAGQSGAFEAYIHDADALHAELTAKGANVLGSPVSHPWGLRTFQVLDLCGNRITFAQPFE